MANRFYIPSRQSNFGPQMMNLGVQLSGLKQQKELALGQQALTEKGLGLGGETLAEQRRVHDVEYGTPATGDPEFPGLQRPATPGLAQQRIGIAERQTALAEQKGAEDADLKNFGIVASKMASNHLVGLGVPKDYPIIQKISEWGKDPKINNAEAYSALLRDYPSYRWDMAEKIADDFTKKAAKDPMYAQTPQGKAQNAMIEAISEDETGERVIGSYFPGTVESMKRREVPRMNAMANMMKAGGPQSDIGKLQEDRKRYLAEGYPEGSPIIHAIDAEMKKKSEMKPEKIPSAGNQADLAVLRKFGDPTYLTDPEKAKIASQWLGTEEGRKGVRDAAGDVTPPSITYLQTAEGFTPAVTRGPGLGTVGKPTGMGKPLSSEMVVATQQIETLKDALKSVEALYKPDYVGAIAGRVAGVKEKTIGIGTDQAKFNSDLAQVKNSLVYLMSGKQINEQEYSRLLDQLPDKNLPPSTFEARMENFKRTVDSIIENRKKGMGGYGTSGEKGKNNDPLGIR